MLVNQLVLVGAVSATVAASLRVAVWITTPKRARDSALERVLVAATLSATFVVCWMLALGLVGLSGSVVALAAGPVAAWLLTMTVIPAVRVAPLSEQLSARWSSAGRAQRVAAAALIGLAAGAVFEVARRPGFGIDALSYHIPDAAGWLHSGHAGAAQDINYNFPVGYYPVTNEVLLAWMLGLSRSFAPLGVWSTAMAALGLAAFWRLLAQFRVGWLAATAALLAIATLPTFLVGINYNGPGTDLPAFSWLVCAGALCVGAVRRPALLAPALLAVGLGVGTKTTVAPVAAGVLVASAFGARAKLAEARWWIAGGVVGALLVGGVWYVRDTTSHGWPLWPFSSGPTGDPLTHTMALAKVSFLSRPAATVSADPSLYLKWIGGAVGLVGGVLAIPLLTRSRAARIAGALAAAAVVVWAAAPYTGASHAPVLIILAINAVRYLLAAFAVCALALALCARDASPLVKRVPVALLLGSAAGSVFACASLGYPLSLTADYLLIGAAAGALVGLVLGSASKQRLPRRAALALPLLAAVLATLFLTLAAPGWLRREVLGGDPYDPVLAFMLNQPGFDRGSQPMAFAPTVLATLAGPRLNHPLALIGAREPCGRVRSRVDRGWVIVQPKAFVPGVTSSFDAARCLRGERPIYDDGTTLVYGPRRT